MPSLTRPAAALLLAVALSACSSGGSGGSSAQATGAPAPEGVDLQGFVGTEEQAEAYEIGLLDAEGKPVTTVPAGTYSLKVTDRAETHNFALRGDGVEVVTSVGDVEDETVEITLEAGEYTYVCDPHPGMTGTLTVT